MRLFPNLLYNRTSFSAKITNAIMLQSTDSRITDLNVRLQIKRTPRRSHLLEFLNVLEVRRTNLLECNGSRGSVIWGLNALTDRHPADRFALHVL